MSPLGFVIPGLTRNPVLPGILFRTLINLSIAENPPLKKGGRGDFAAGLYLKFPRPPFDKGG